MPSATGPLLNPISFVTRVLRTASLSGVLTVGGVLAVAAFFGLLTWGMVKADGKPGRLGVFSELGAVKVTQRTAANFTINTFNGGSVTVADLRGKVVMVDFWASWCPPCRKEAPVLAQVYQEYRTKGVEFLGVDIWDKEQDAKDFISRFNITYPSGPDAQHNIAVEYGVTGIPEKYFLSPEGMLLKKFVGPMDSGQLRGVLDELLTGTKETGD